MFYFKLIFFISVLLLSAEMASPTILKDGDLIFVKEGTSDFSHAISEATAANDSIKFIHVGIIEIVDGHPFVIEASPEKGVREIPYSEFTDAAMYGYTVKRLSVEFPVDAALQRAKSHLGEAYDWWYLPENNKMYCSELVFESFLYDSGEHIFKSQPMNFRGPDGSMPTFWINLFQELGTEIPEGIEGTNPNDLSKDERLYTVDQAADYFSQ